MIRFYFSCFLIFAFSFAGYSQLSEIKVKITDDLPKYTDLKSYKKSATIPKNVVMIQLNMPVERRRLSILSV